MLRLLLLVVLLVACPGTEAEPVEDCPPAEEVEYDVMPGSTTTIGPVERPADIIVPFAYDGTRAMPVVFLLHGYGVSAQLQDFLFKFQSRVDDDRFLLVMPNGTTDEEGNNHWNATDACCDFGGLETDDVGYLTGLLDEVEERFRVDSSRVYFTGHSNGGYMSYRMACEIPDRIAAILPLAGATWLDDTLCDAESPVAVLHVHGTEDPDVLYEGDFDYPGAVASVETWAARNGCDVGAATVGESLDLIPSLDGAETSVLNYTEGCACGAESTLWTLEDEGHIPPFTETFAEQAIAWLFERRIP